MKKRLTINSDLQIFFDDNDKARFDSVRGAPVEAVKAELIEWQAFVETWLVEVEDQPKPERLNLAQQRLKKQFTPLTNLFRRRLKMTGNEIREVLPQPIAAAPEAYPDLSSAQIQAVMDSLVSE
jgi:hypothetical protein